MGGGGRAVKAASFPSPARSGGEGHPPDCARQERPAQSGGTSPDL